MNRTARRHGRRTPPGVQHEPPKQRASAGARHRHAPAKSGRWRLPVIVAVALLLGLLIGFRVWQQSQPPQPDVNALHADIAAGRTGAEVTFLGSVVAPPVNAGDHEQIEVKDSLGDQLELDYNTQLGQWIPVHVGDTLTVHGQLYVDPGRAGVHCLHAQTSSGCPLPGWIEVGARTYS